MSAIAEQPHPVTRALAAVRAELTSAVDVPVWSMSAQETAHAIAELAAIESQTAELKARILGHADRTDTKDQAGMPNTAAWLARQTRTTRAAANRAMRLAARLDHHELTRNALAAGTVLVEQAEVILNAVEALPDDLAPIQVVKAEAHLLDEAAHYDAKALKWLGLRLMEVVAPDAADAHEAKLLEAEERKAAEATRLTLWHDNQGKSWIKGCFDTAITGNTLEKMLFAIASPRHQASKASKASKGALGEVSTRRPTPERLGQAFTELIQRYPLKRLPQMGGINATVVVTETLETLMGGLKAAHLDTGHKISPGLARRLACQAGIIPAVLGTNSEVLDLGRKSRLFTTPQRLAKIIEKGSRCEIDGCDLPGTHAHHHTRWTDGGTTNLRDQVGLCPWHHTKAHDPRYEMTKLPTGVYTFHRRE